MFPVAEHILHSWASSGPSVKRTTVGRFFLHTCKERGTFTLIDSPGLPSFICFVF